MTFRVEVVSVDAREFSRRLLQLGAMGGILPDDGGAFKGQLLRCLVELPDEANIPDVEQIRRLPVERAPRANFTTEVADVVVPEGGKYTREQLENMSLKQIKEALGVEQGTKKELIQKYFGE